MDLNTFQSFGAGYFTEKTQKYIENKNIITKNYKIQENELIMCGHFLTGFIDFMFKGKSLLDYTNVFSPNEY